MNPEAKVSRKGADRIHALHPWIFQSDVIDVAAEPGDLVLVRSERGRPLGWATWSQASQIALRMVSTDPTPPGDDRAWITDRVRAARRTREQLAIDSTAFRLVHAESDGLPATIVDVYGDGADVYLVVQTLSQGADRRLSTLVEVLVNEWHPRGIVARNDPKVRRLEGLDERVDVLYGDVPERVTVTEGGIRFAADLREGQKTGLFLDQRENHAAAAAYTTGDALDAFTYNGGFALHMARRASNVLALDASAAAIATTEANAAANRITNVEAREANVFDALRELELEKRRFDTIVLDPPAFAKNKASVTRAIAGYKEINLRAIKLLRPGGYLVTCSCSYNIDPPLFRDILRSASADAGVRLTLVEDRLQARDHPVLLTVPETSYLKCLVLRRPR